MGRQGTVVLTNFAAGKRTFWPTRVFCQDAQARKRPPCSRGSFQTGLMPSTHQSLMGAKRWSGSCRPIVMAPLAAPPTRANIKNTKRCSSRDLRRPGLNDRLWLQGYFRTSFGKCLQSDVIRSMPASVVPATAMYDDISADAKGKQRFGLLIEA